MNGRSRVFAFFLLIHFSQFVFTQELDKKLHLMVKDIKDCDNTLINNDFKINTELKEKDAKLVLNSLVELPFAIDESVVYSVNISMWLQESNSWRTMFYINGTLCNGFKIIPKLWKRVSEAAKVKSECPIPPGHYELTDFSASSEDADVPLMIMPGKFLVESHIYKDDKIMLCKKLEVEGS